MDTVILGRPRLRMSCPRAVHVQGNDEFHFQGHLAQQASRNARLLDSTQGIGHAVRGLQTGNVTRGALLMRVSFLQFAL